MIAEPSITCPRCGMTSYNANDIREGYCGNCHDWTTVVPTVALHHCSRDQTTDCNCPVGRCIFRG